MSRRSKAVQSNDENQYESVERDDDDSEEENEEFATEEDLEYLERYAEFGDAIDLIRTTSETVKTRPIRVILKNLDDLPQKTTLDQHAGRIFDIFIKLMIQKAGGNLQNTKFWLNLQHPAYVEKDGFWIIHKTYKMANGHTLINTIAKHSQSKAELGFDETLTLTMRIFTREKKKKTLHGRGGRIPDKILNKFGLKNANVLGDSHCLPKALALGKIWSDMNECEDPEEKRLLASELRSLTRPDKSIGFRRTRQQEEAEKLLLEVGMDPDVGVHTRDDLEELAAYLEDYRICVWTMAKGCAFPSLEIELNDKATGGFIPIFYANEHYDFFQPSVAKVNARFCFKCHKLDGKNHSKRCKNVCPRCGRDQCEPGHPEYCSECSINFHSKECYAAHLEKRSIRAVSYCMRYEKCLQCGHIHRRENHSHDIHVCHQYDFCNICMQKISGNHECSHAAPTEAARKRSKKRQESWVMVFYDIESVVSSSADYQGIASVGIKHEPNLICYRLICNKCLGRHCVFCGPSQYFSFKLRDGESGTVLERFVQVLKTDPRLKNAFIIAHNGGRYDHVFALEELMKEENYSPEFTLSGTTFITADVTIEKGNKLHFRDSVKYLPMRLSQLPDAFELETKSKGYFPYLYNHPDNYDTPLQCHPAIDFYEPKYMREKERENFEKWYEENKDQPFDLEEQLISYCMTDLQILVEAVVKFINICGDHFAGWNPIIQAPTLASYVLFVMKMEHIKDGDIGYIPENGYGGRNNSKFALKYLLWLEHKNPELRLIHKLRPGGEQRLVCNRSAYYVDGYDPETRKVYEINGCMWHGCDKCYLDRDAKCPRNKNQTMDELFFIAKSKENDIQIAGYPLCVKWECEIKEELQKDAEMAHFFKNCHHVHQLFPREAMYGGRTQQFQSLFEVDEEYSAEFVDFCSLYPYVNMRGTEYPRGVPTRIKDEFKEIVPGQPLPYKGLVFCDLLPSLNCAIPVAPTRVDGKLVFILCKSCGTSKKKPAQCPHTKVSERFLTGVWCTDELNLAIQEGYQILKYHEVWHWDSRLWFKGGFFESFMTPLLKMKHEASGWPRSDMTDGEKQEHLNAIRDNDGIEMEMENVKKNPALRSLAKLFLNSTWGKFAQNPCKSETKLIPINKAVEAAKFISAPGNKPLCFEEWGDNHILVSRKPVKEAVNTARFTNIVYGALTTSAARIRLYEAMKRVGAENLIYCDTDSIIYRQKRGEDVLRDLRGDALGKLTNEVPSGWTIKEIVAMAPKVYALKMVDADGNEKCVTKAKGITLNSETAEKVNFETMKQLMKEHLRGRKNCFNVHRMRMKRGANILDGLNTVMEAKRLRPVMDKGHFNETGVLFPFGKIDEEIELEDDYQF